MTTTIDRAQDYVVAPEEIIMTTLLTPPAGDTRTAEEYTFDLISSGQYYAAAPTIRLDANGQPNKYDTGEYSWKWMDVHTPLATLSDGTPVVGTYEVDGSPHCVHLETEDGHFYVGPDGHLAGEWAGIDLEIPPEALPKLCALFSGEIPHRLQELARQWAGPTEDPRRSIAREADRILREHFGGDEGTAVDSPPSSLVTVSHNPEGWMEYELDDDTGLLVDDTSGGGSLIWRNTIYSLRGNFDSLHQLIRLLDDPRVRRAIGYPAPESAVVV